MESILPKPVQMRAGPGYTEFAFAVDDTEGPPAHLQFQFKPATFGHVRGRVLEGLPVLVMRDGTWDKQTADKMRVDEAEVMTAARTSQGLERIDEDKHATVENDGTISIVPRDGS
jgi:hypothetical protein